jgi:NosR/NirI family transcriptional regulator, nitrous oxide reductase regulator
MNLLSRYMRWLHTRWPAGHVEKLPVVNPDGSTAVPGLYVVGDITGIPLLKFSSDTGARAVQTMVADAGFAKRDKDVSRDGKKVLDLVVVGAGVSGVAAAIEAKKNDLSFELLEASEPFSTLVNFPKGKPIFTYPTGMTPAGELQFGEGSAIKEGLVDQLHGYLKKHDIQPKQVRAERITRKGGLLEVVIPNGENLLAHRVVVGIGRSGNFRKLGVPGEELGKVSNRLHDPKDYCGKKVLIVGGGDTAMETAIALGACGSHVTVSYRKPEFSRPKQENVEKLRMLADDPMAEDAVVEEPSSERITTAAGAFLNDHRKPGSVTLLMASKVKEIRDIDVVVTDAEGVDKTIENEAVFTMIGREAPLDFFRRSGVPIRGEWRVSNYVSFALFFAFCVFLYHWKSNAGFDLKGIFKSHHWFPFNIAGPDNPANLIGTLLISMQKPSFWYSLAYCLCIVIFGIRRIKRRKTPYVKLQTLTLMSIQCVPLFLLPYILLPWMGHNGLFNDGVGKAVADALFPLTQWDNHGREYWRSVGFILAWPLMFWNVFTYQPIWAWLVIGSLQTFVLIPLIVWRWGKGAYCGWICSCGALAETMGDAHRHKMPHGPRWNRLNMLGQVFLWIITGLLVLRIVSWIAPGGWATAAYNLIFEGKDANGSPIGGVMRYFNYVWSVDLLWAGIFGVAFYFWFSGRVWCRFACPLAALMHIYARFSQFRILSEKKKCISCNVCTSVCHQGIDIMNFANKGLPMEDPQCVRCSACVQSCPTGVLSFGRINRNTGEVLGVDTLGASPVRMAELTVNGKTV